jgi:hypothetical protein
MLLIWITVLLITCSYKFPVSVWHYAAGGSVAMLANLNLLQLRALFTESSFRPSSCSHQLHDAMAKYKNWSGIVSYNTNFSKQHLPVA